MCERTFTVYETIDENLKKIVSKNKAFECGRILFEMKQSKKRELYVTKSKKNLV